MEGGLIFWCEDSIASKRTFTLSEVLLTTYGVKGEFSDFAGTIDTEFIPNPYFSIVTGRSKPFAIGMYRKPPAGARMGRPGIRSSTVRQPDSP